MKRVRSKGVSAAVFAVLLSACIWFVAWTLRLTFDNTCLELKEQYSYSEASEIVSEIETGIRFGKSLDNFHGMDRVVERLTSLLPGEAEAAVLKATGEPIYTSFQGKETEREYIARLYTKAYQEKEGIGVSFGSSRSMILPIRDYDGELLGKVVLIYDKESLLLPDTHNWIPEIALVLFLTVLSVIFYRRTKLGNWIPLMLVMAGLLAEMGLLYTSYQKQYESIIYENAGSLSETTSDKVAELLEKGYPAERLESLTPYFEQKAKDNAIIWNIRIVRSYMDTAEVLERVDQDTLVSPVTEDQDVLVTVNRAFINDQMGEMTAKFAAIFLICLMISYEVMKVTDILRLKQESSEQAETQETGFYETTSLNIKLLSFVSYTAIYASMPYAAVLIREWKASLFGLSPELSASLPLSMELTGILLFSFLIPKLCQKMDQRILFTVTVGILIGGNIGCVAVENPYALLTLRGVCSLGFALLKYLMNAIVSSGSQTPDDVGRNFASLNAGLLGGITVGGAVGAVIADAKGYQFNYVFTVVVLMILLVGIGCLIPWKALSYSRLKEVESARSAGLPIRSIFRNREVLKVLVLGDVPLNIGLMYVVAFLPVYMNFMGQSAVSISYAYLINGLCGVYLGVALLKPLRFLPSKTGVVIAMLLGAGGILVLSLSGSLGVIFLSAAIMGLFDGYGTPKITGFFTSLPQVAKFDTAQMLTVFNIVGSAVQIACPLLYNLTMQEGGGTGYLTILGGAYVAVAGLFLFLVKGEVRE